LDQEEQQVPALYVCVLVGEGKAYIRAIQNTHTHTHTHLEDVGRDGGGGSVSYLPQHLTVELVLKQRVKQTRCDDVLHGADVVVQTRKLD